jgi:thiol-disulfide isomerase/thioredoxin
MKKILLLTTIFLRFSSANAQNTAVIILKKTIDKFDQLKSLGYNEKAIQKNPFSTGDTSFYNSQTKLTFDVNKMVKVMNVTLKSYDEKTSFRTIYKDSVYSIDLNDSTYSVDPVNKKSEVSNDLVDLIASIKTAVNKTPEKIFQKRDTLIDKSNCYQFLIKVFDTIAKGNHDYTYHYVYINKKTFLPVVLKKTGLGTAEKDGYVLGRLSIFDEQHFSTYRLNEEYNPSDFEFDRSAFSPVNTHMLAIGTIAPELRLRDLAGNAIDPSKFKNKVLLIEFGATACGANPLANPMLNRLNGKYPSADFSIVSIYSDESADKVKKYIESNKLEFPVYKGTSKLRKEFSTLGTPNFYLLDKSGNIVKSVDGYNDTLEKDLSTAIETYIGK